MEPAAEGGRRCEHCACRVHDAGELSEAELDELLERSDTQRVCLRSELVGGRPRLAAGVAASVFVAALAGCAAPSSSFLIEAPELSFVELIELGGGSAESLAAGGVGVIGGVVTNLDGEPVDNAIVVLQSAALPETRERMTNARGIYVFKDLPEGNYTLQVLVGRANVSKVTSLPAGAKFRANFKLDPEASRGRAHGGAGREAEGAARCVEHLPLELGLDRRLGLEGSKFSAGGSARGLG